MRAKRIGSAAAAGGVLALVAAPVAGWAASAPAGSATGTAVQVGVGGQPVVGVSNTSASDGQGSSSASSQTVQVLGQNVGPTGSSENGGAPQSGSLAGTPPASPVQVGIAQYSDSSQDPNSGTSHSSSADASLVHANAGGSSGVTADVAKSHSDAKYSSDGSWSSGSSSSDGALVNAGGSSGLNVDVLHSGASTDASGTGQGSSYLADVGGGGSDSGPIGTSSDVGKICTSLSNALLQLACVTATGGLGYANGTVGDVTVPMPGGSGSLLSAVLFGATAGQGSGAGTGVMASSAGSPSVVSPTGASTPAGATASPTAAGSTPGAPTASPTAASGPSGNLPFTGADLEIILLASGLLLTAGGAALRISSAVRPRLVR